MKITQQRPFLSVCALLRQKFTFAACFFPLCFAPVLQSCGVASDSTTESTSIRPAKASSQAIQSTSEGKSFKLQALRRGDEEIEITALLLSRIRLNLVAERIVADAGTAKKTLNSEDVILNTLVSSLCDSSGNVPTKEQKQGILNALRSKIRAQFGEEWVLALVRASGLSDEMATLEATKKPLLQGIIGAIAELFGAQGSSSVTLKFAGSLDIDGNSVLISYNFR